MQFKVISQEWYRQGNSEKVYSNFFKIAHTIFGVTVFAIVIFGVFFSYCCILHHFLTMPVGIGLKPEVGGIKIVTV